VKRKLPEPLSFEELRTLLHHLRTEASFRDLVSIEFFLDTGAGLKEVHTLNLE